MYSKEYYQKNRERILERQKEYHKKTYIKRKDKILNYSRLYHIKNKLKRNKQNRDNYHNKYKKDEEFKNKRTENSKRLYHEDEEYRRKCIIRAKDRKNIKKDKCQMLNCGSKKDLQLHHWNYDKPNSFSILCSYCHNVQHNKMKGGDLYV